MTRRSENRGKEEKNGIDESEPDEIEKLFGLLIESATDYAIFATDPDRRVRVWNKGAERILGYTEEEIVGESADIIFTPEDRADRVPEREMETTLRTGRAEDNRWHLRRDGSRFFATGVMTQLRDGKLHGFVKILRDHTKQKLTEDLLRENEQMLRHLTGNIPGGSLNVFDLELTYLFADGQGLAEVGLDSARLVGKKLADVFPADQVEYVTPFYRRAFGGETLTFELEAVGRCYLISAAPLEGAGGAIDSIIVLAQDVTERKRAEKALRDKEMLQKLVAAQEDERRRIARELDNELGQKLTALRLKIESLGGNAGEESLKYRLDEIREIAGQIDDGVDYLAWDLRPASLDDFGLAAALDRFVREWSSFTKIKAELLGSDLRGERFAPETEINLYRIAQEALGNVYKHSGATKVEVMLALRGDSVTIIVEDDGAGFDANVAGVLDETAGLSGIMQRAELIGGRFEIESTPGKGTTVYVTAPISNAV